MRARAKLGDRWRRAISFLDVAAEVHTVSAHVGLRLKGPHAYLAGYGIAGYFAEYRVAR